MFKDHFSHNSVSYSRHRPGYPDSLFSYLSSICKEHRLAWDCATGSGQSAVQLTKYFRKVIATDASDSQISNALKHAGVNYLVSTAEDSMHDDSCVDLVTVAQALHWFDLPRFTAEVDRTLKPAGILAVWSYNLLKEPLINYAISLAYRLIHNQGGALKACLGLVKSDNAESESACKPRRARPEAYIYGIVLLAKDRAIRREARFVAARFRSCRDMA